MTVSQGRLPETFNFSDREGCLGYGLINIADSLSLHGLHIAVGYQAADGAAGYCGNSGTSLSVCFPKAKVPDKRRRRFQFSVLSLYIWFHILISAFFAPL